MSFNYRQKIDAIRYLSTPENWVSRFDENWFLNPARKDEHVIAGTIVTGYSSDSTKERATGSRYAEIRVEKTNGGYMITDESGAKLAIHGTYATPQDCILIPSDEWAKTFSASAVRLDKSGLQVTIDAKGTKAVFVESVGQSFLFKAPTVEREKQLQSGAFLHAITLNLPGFEDRPYWEHINAAKLILAHDFYIEPEIQAQNALKTFEEWEMNGDIPKKILAIKEDKVWNDSTEFSGFTVDVPRRFVVEYTGKDYRLATSFDRKNDILNEGLIVRDGIAKTQSSVNLDPNGFDTEKLAQAFNKGISLRDRQGRQWTATSVTHSTGGWFAKRARKFLANDLLMDPHDFVAVNFDPQSTLIGVASEAFNTNYHAQRASLDVLRAAEHGLPAGMNAHDFLSEKLAQGADPKYLGIMQKSERADAFNHRSKLTGNSIRAHLSHEAAKYVQAGRFGQMIFNKGGGRRSALLEAFLNMTGGDLLTSVEIPGPGPDAKIS